MNFIPLSFSVALSGLPNFCCSPNPPGGGPAPHHQCTIHLNSEHSDMIHQAFLDAEQGKWSTRYAHTIIPTFRLICVIQTWLVMKSSSFFSFQADARGVPPLLSGSHTGPSWMSRDVHLLSVHPLPSVWGGVVRWEATAICWPGVWLYWTVCPWIQEPDSWNWYPDPAWPWEGIWSHWGEHLPRLNVPRSALPSQTNSSQSVLFNSWNQGPLPVWQRCSPR